jgi:hypothetical protein
MQNMRQARKENARGVEMTDAKLITGIVSAMKTLSITGDSLFAAIREELERGLMREARSRLDFVDKIIDSSKEINRQ